MKISIKMAKYNFEVGMQHNQYFIRCPLAAMTSEILLFIDLIVLSITFIGVFNKVSFTLFQKSVNFSFPIFLSKASTLNFCFTTLKMFSIGFKSGLRGGMENCLDPTSSKAVFDFLLFWLGSPS